MLRWLMKLFGRYSTAPDERQRDRTAALQVNVDDALKEIREQQETFNRRTDDLAATVEHRRNSMREAIQQLRWSGRR